MEGELVAVLPVGMIFLKSGAPALPPVNPQKKGRIVIGGFTTAVKGNMPGFADWREASPLALPALMRGGG